MSEAVRRVIIRLAEGNRPDTGEITAAFEEILGGAADPILISAFLMGLRLRQESVEDIVAGARVLRRNARRVSAPEGAVDTCGTGGLAWTSLNTSTAAAFVAAGAGVKVAKHGNRSKSKAGSADVLEALGVNLQMTDAQLEASFSAAGLAFMFAPAHHSAMRHVAPVRATLGIRTIFNLLGPLANPAGVRRQVLGVFSAEWTEPLAQALGELGSERALVVHGLDGIDEISITGSTRISELRDGLVRTTEVTPETLGVARARLEDLRGGSVSDNAAALRAVLNGAGGPFSDLVAVNAGAAIMIAGLAADIPAGIELARRSVSSGAALRALETLKATSHE